jgi:hypothetical protein
VSHFGGACLAGIRARVPFKSAGDLSYRFSGARRIAFAQGRDDSFVFFDFTTQIKLFGAMVAHQSKGKERQHSPFQHLRGNAIARQFPNTPMQVQIVEKELGE